MRWSYTKRMHCFVDRNLHVVAVYCHEEAASKIYGTSSLWEILFVCDVVSPSANSGQDKTSKLWNWTLKTIKTNYWSYFLCFCFLSWASQLLTYMSGHHCQAMCCWFTGGPHKNYSSCIRRITHSVEPFPLAWAAALIHNSTFKVRQMIGVRSTAVMQCLELHSHVNRNVFTELYVVL